MASCFHIYSMTKILYFLYNLLDIYILYKIHVDLVNFIKYLINFYKISYKLNKLSYINVIRYVYTL